MLEYVHQGVLSVNKALLSVYYVPGSWLAQRRQAPRDMHDQMKIQINICGTERHWGGCEQGADLPEGQRYWDMLEEGENAVGGRDSADFKVMILSCLHSI